MHKVRNFYNNILVPNSAAGHVTIDTHAVAAAFFKALSGASAEVMHNFGGAASKGLPSPGKSTLTGASGTYGFIADAYRDAAARIAKEDNIKLLPREIQSITWETIRAIFPAAWKRENMNKVEDIYNRAKSGEITLAQAKSETEALATTKGRLINPFAWEGETSGDFVSDGGKSFDQDIHPDVAKRKARVMPPHTLKDTLRVNITSATDKIPGIDVLFKEANKGSLAATKVIQDAAQYNLEHLLSDIPEARISYDRGIGLYGGKREPTLGLNINFPSDSRNVVLAALNKFSASFNLWRGACHDARRNL